MPDTAAPRIFVSHSHEDDAYCRAYVDELRRLLGGERDAVWYDEHNLGSGELLREIQRQLHARPIFVVILSQAALHRSKWVADECSWAYDLYRAEPNRTILPVTGAPITSDDFYPDWLYLEGYKRVEAPGLLPFPPQEAARRTSAAIPRSPLSAPAAAQPPLSAPAEVRAPLSAHGEGPGVRTPPIPPERFPPRLAALGFTAHISPDGTEYILSPLCPVPAGDFLMGSDPKQDSQAIDNEQPQFDHPPLPAYQIARHPVTVAEYACYVQAGGQIASPDRMPWTRQLDRLDHPVVCVTWYNARDYAAWLADRTSDRRWHLPSEAEWEKAARWDARRRHARIYPWGDEFDTRRCNTRAGGIGDSTPVGTYAEGDANGASPCGAQDMAGNVWEWTRTIWDPQAYSKRTFREDEDSTANRVLRGGSWSGRSTGARAAYRVGSRPGGVNDIVGFRLALCGP